MFSSLKHQLAIGVVVSDSRERRFIDALGSIKPDALGDKPARARTKRISAIGALTVAIPIFENCKSKIPKKTCSVI